MKKQVKEIIEYNASGANMAGAQYVELKNKDFSKVVDGANPNGAKLSKT